MNPSPDVTEHPTIVLIVDDERHNRRLLEVMLAPEGFILMAAASGEEALAMIARQPPDLILLDIMMPGMNGYQVASLIKGNLATKNIPIIMVTTLDERDARMQGLGAGAEDFLTKPVDRAELCMRVRNLLRLKAYGDYHGQYSQMLEGEVGTRTADLIESERLYRSTFDAAPVGIVHVAVDGTWLRVNPRAVELLGYARDQLEGSVGNQLTQAEDAPGEAEAVAEMVAGRRERHLIAEKRFRRGDGSFIWMRINISAHRHADARMQHLIFVFEDVTERRLLEDQIRQSVTRLSVSERRYRTLLDHANDAIAVLTPEGIVREVNHRWVELSGRPSEELIGRSWRDFSRGHASSGREQAARQGAAEPEPSRDALVELVRPDGSGVLMELSNATVDVGGESLVFTIGRDVTEHRRLEKQLREAQRLELIGQLAGGVAHDFNNILTAISGFSAMVIDALAPEDPVRADAIEIMIAGERAAGLTRQLLAFGRQQLLQPSVVDLNTLIAGMETMLRRLIAEHVTLVVSLQPALGAVKIDPTQVEQILVNLAVNAADAMPRGGILTIETADVRLDEHYRRHHAAVKPGEYVLLAVSDTGVGMDEATSEHIFEPFFTTKEVGKGTGLGLATVYGIVKQSGGDIWVYSELGHGSTFKVYLPRVCEPVAAAVRAPSRTPEVPRGSETILLVEDDEVLRRLARLILERSGYVVLAAADPVEALRVAGERGGPIDLLLSDVIMPHSEGAPLFQRLLAIRPHLRVLYMSGYADEAIVRQGVIVEGTPFLQKPFTPLALTRKIRDVLDGSAGGGARRDDGRPPPEG